MHVETADLVTFVCICFFGLHAEAEIEKMKGDIMKAADHWRWFSCWRLGWCFSQHDLIRSLDSAFRFQSFEANEKSKKDVAELQRLQDDLQSQKKQLFSCIRINPSSQFVGKQGLAMSCNKFQKFMLVRANVRSNVRGVSGLQCYLASISSDAVWGSRHHRRSSKMPKRRLRNSRRSSPSSKFKDARKS